MQHHRNARLDLFGCAWPACAQPAEEIRQFELAGIRGDGRAVGILFSRRRCVAGHVYDIEVAELAA
jgi:hypothetical protein